MSSNLTFGNINAKIATDQNIIDRTAGAFLDASRVAPNDIITVDSDVTLPTVNAVKNFVGNATAGGVTYRGTISLPATFFGTTSNNYLNNSTDVETGDMFVAIGSGNLTMADGDIFVGNGDALIINTSNPKNKITKSMIDDISPTYPGIEVGDYKRRAVSYSPGLGWLLCDGQAVSRTTYSLLFNVIGTTFGVGDGSTTFNLPNANGRVSVTAGSANGLTTRFVGDVFGEEDVTLTEAQIAAHTHDYTYQYKQQTAPYGNNNRTVWEYVENRTRTTTSAGGGQSHNNLQPSIVDGFLFIYAGV
jgi:microcystin-dependent protein